MIKRRKEQVRKAVKKYREKQYDKLLCITGDGKPAFGLSCYCKEHRDERNKRELYRKHFLRDFK